MADTINGTDPTPGTWITGRLTFGLVLPHWIGGMAGRTPTGREVVALGVFAERCGFDSLWLFDHFRFDPHAVFGQFFGRSLPATPPGHVVGVYECWTTLAALAAATERVELGTLVANTGYRNPALLAQMAATVESISGGRLVLGLGAGDFPDEHASHGYPFEGRVGRFDEALRIIRPMLRGESVDLEGEHYQVAGAAVGLPRPRPDGPPVMIGLISNKPRMQRLIAQYANEWNKWSAWDDARPESYAEARQSMEEACVRHGRDPATLRRHVTLDVVMPGFEKRQSRNFPTADHPLTGSTEQIVEHIHRWAEQGVTRLSIVLTPATEAGVEWLAGVIDAARAVTGGRGAVQRFV